MHLPWHSHPAMKSSFSMIQLISIKMTLHREGKANQAMPHQEHRRDAHLSYVGRWARRWINHLSLWRMASVMPDLRLPSQMQSITALWPLVPNYTAWWTKARVRTTCPRLLSHCAPTWSRSWDLSVTSLARYCYTPSHTVTVQGFFTEKRWHSFLKKASVDVKISSF